ncbi:dTMP kinase [Fonticella tunisiensis]|uniref:Thymidylate kinase n=1 Tax=Fonticella tunisiensis TaxID=1096341 RepID=A0A4R7KAX5_9CLOT|nr:dTMP kinase [Fonticella tunisiensis]TDT50574.1 dTMP kinase [Fonticella tunisiensis]
MRGLFITFEGPDGSGKSTQINLLRKHLESRGYDVLFTREPGGTPISEKIRKIILDPENKGMNSVCEALLYAASRAQLVHEVIKPALESGKIVIADRFVDSSIVYQGYARGLGEDMIESINRYAVLGEEPDVTFLITLPPEEGIKRKNRGGKLDRLEQENILFHKKVLEGYNNIKGKYSRIVPIDGTLGIDEIHHIIKDKIDFILKGGLL